uniref:Uncharacterized protein n=1 Tax=Denticeps clupeoides TaxID=299321 RepID=A0AAY3ZW26_9TELE
AGSPAWRGGPGPSGWLPGVVRRGGPGPSGWLPGVVRRGGPGPSAWLPGVVPLGGPGPSAWLPGVVPLGGPGSSAWLPGVVPLGGPGPSAWLPGVVPLGGPGPSAWLSGVVPLGGPGPSAWLPGVVPLGGPGPSAWADPSGYVWALSPHVPSDTSCVTPCTAQGDCPRASGDCSRHPRLVPSGTMQPLSLHGKAGRRLEQEWRIPCEAVPAAQLLAGDLPSPSSTSFPHTAGRDVGFHGPRDDPGWARWAEPSRHRLPKRRHPGRRPCQPRTPGSHMGHHGRRDDLGRARWAEPSRQRPPTENPRHHRFRHPCPPTGDSEGRPPCGHPGPMVR